MKGEAMSQNIMTLALSVAPASNNYPTTPTWSTNFANKRAYAHFGIGALGVNG
jgi:hypothetical protein